MSGSSVQRCWVAFILHLHDVTEVCTLQASRFWAGASDSDEEEDKATTSEEESTDDSSSSDSENEQKKGPSR